MKTQTAFSRSSSAIIICTCLAVHTFTPTLHAAEETAEAIAMRELHSILKQPAYDNVALLPTKEETDKMVPYLKSPHSYRLKGWVSNRRYIDYMVMYLMDRNLMNVVLVQIDTKHEEAPKNDVVTEWRHYSHVNETQYVFMVTSTMVMGTDDYDCYVAVDLPVPTSNVVSAASSVFERIVPTARRAAWEVSQLAFRKHDSIGWYFLVTFTPRQRDVNSANIAREELIVPVLCDGTAVFPSVWRSCRSIGNGP